MDIKTAEHILNIIESSQLNVLYDKLLRSAIRYTSMRTKWYMSSQEDRIAMDPERTAAHNAFISACDIMARNMAQHGEDGTWRRELTNDRKIVGDFACYITAIVGVRAR